MLMSGVFFSGFFSPAFGGSGAVPWKGGGGSSPSSGSWIDTLFAGQRNLEHDGIPPALPSLG